MSSTQPGTGAATNGSAPTAVSQRLELVILPVGDVDRAKRFYDGLGWRLDIDAGGGDFRVVQMTPPGSNASIAFGTGVTSAQPGSVDRIVLAVDDLAAARADLLGRGVDVSEPFHDAAGSLAAGFHADPGARASGADPEGRSYATYATFTDPDGNVWMLQEITQRLPGRVRVTDVSTLAKLLHETAEHHDPYEKASPPHDWWDWYAAYFDARQGGATPEEASAEAGRYMAEVKHVG